MRACAFILRLLRLRRINYLALPREGTRPHRKRFIFFARFGFVPFCLSFYFKMQSQDAKHSFFSQCVLHSFFLRRRRCAKIGADTKVELMFYYYRYSIIVPGCNDEISKPLFMTFDTVPSRHLLCLQVRSTCVCTGCAFCFYVA